MQEQPNHTEKSDVPAGEPGERTGALPAEGAKPALRALRGRRTKAATGGGRAGAAGPAGVPAAKPAQPKPPTSMAPQEPREGYTAVGRVLRPHGLKGELRVQVFAAGAPNLQAGANVYLAGERRRVSRSREDRGAWLVTLQGISDRNAAEPWRGWLLEVQDEEVRRSDSESYFIHELLGLRVETEDGRELGRVTEVLQPGANDVYVVSGPGGEVLVPAIGEVVRRINVRDGLIIITPLVGMLDETV